MRYRIVEKDGKLKVQARWFGLFWITERWDDADTFDHVFPDMEAAEAYIYEKLHRSVQIVRRVYKGSRRLIYLEM